MKSTSIPSNGDENERGTLGLALAFDHPSIDPEDISRCLGIQPSMTAMAGSHVVNVHGEEVAARHRESKWRLYRRFLPSARELDDVSSVIGDVVSMLEQHTDLVTSIADEGRVLIWLQFNGADHRGIELSSDLLHRMATLHVDFGMEVFPHGLG